LVDLTPPHFVPLPNQNLDFEIVWRVLSVFSEYIENEMWLFVLLISV